MCSLSLDSVLFTAVSVQFAPGTLPARQHGDP